MYRYLTHPKAVKTYAWAVVSGLVFLASGLAAGAELAPVLKATALAVALKSPVYAAFEVIWHRLFDRRPSNAARPVPTAVVGA